MKETKDNIHAGHRKRLRTQVLATKDFSSLPPHVVLETMLSFSIARKDVNPLAHELLNTFGSLDGVLDAPRERLLQIKGLGEVAVDHIKFCAMMPDIIKAHKTRNKYYIRTSRDALSYLQKNVAVTATEKFYYMAMDNNGKVIMLRCLNQGSIDKIFLDLRDLISQITAIPTASIVFCHTHPHGNPTPSRSDIEFTKKLESVLTSIDILLCDHIILSTDSYFSFYEQGLVRRDSGPMASKFKNVLAEI